MATNNRSISEILQDVLRDLQSIVRSEILLAKTVDQQTNKALETWDNIERALIGVAATRFKVAATRFKDFARQVIPGFHEQFRKTRE
jgi:hypothetical protein